MLPLKPHNLWIIFHIFGKYNNIIVQHSCSSTQTTDQHSYIHYTNALYAVTTAISGILAELDQFSIEIDKRRREKEREAALKLNKECNCDSGVGKNVRVDGFTMAKERPEANQMGRANKQNFVELQNFANGFPCHKPLIQFQNRESADTEKCQRIKIPSQHPLSDSDANFESKLLESNLSQNPVIDTSNKLKISKCYTRQGEQIKKLEENCPECCSLEHSKSIKLNSGKGTPSRTDLSDTIDFGMKSQRNAFITNKTEFSKNDNNELLNAFAKENSVKSDFPEVPLVNEFSSPLDEEHSLKYNEKETSKYEIAKGSKIHFSNTFETNDEKLIFDVDKHSINVNDGIKPISNNDFSDVNLTPHPLMDLNFQKSQLDDTNVSGFSKCDFDKVRIEENENEITINYNFELTHDPYLYEGPKTFPKPLAMSVKEDLEPLPASKESESADTSFLFSEASKVSLSELPAQRFMEECQSHEIKNKKSDDHEFWEESKPGAGREPNRDVDDVDSDESFGGEQISGTPQSFKSECAASDVNIVEDCPIAKKIRDISEFQSMYSNPIKSMDSIAQICSGNPNEILSNQFRSVDTHFMLVEDSSVLQNQFSSKRSLKGVPPHSQTALSDNTFQGNKDGPLGIFSELQSKRSLRPHFISPRTQHETKKQQQQQQTQSSQQNQLDNTNNGRRKRGGRKNRRRQKRVAKTLPNCGPVSVRSSEC